MRIGNHPAIARALATGYPNGTPEGPVCPICNDECDTIYRDALGDCVGCNNCIKSMEAWDAPECFKE